jgi:drug/metabolite transporter (DMT)-like permease
MNKGILYILISGICFIIVNFFVKLLGPGQENVLGELQDYPAHELVLARSVVSFAISFVIIRRRKLPVFGNNKRWLIIRGVSGMIALTIFFYTIHYLPIAVAATVQYLAPIFTVIFAMILLKERVKLLQWLFIGLSFIGVMLIAFSKRGATDGVEEISLFWFGLGIVSAVLSGVAYVSIMKLKTTDAPITIVSYFPMISIPFMIVLCFIEFTMPQRIEWLYLLIIGIFTQFAQITMTKAFHEGSASTITPFQYLGSIYAFVVGYFIFDERLNNMIEIGIVLVVSGVAINAILRKPKRTKA